MQHPQTTLVGISFGIPSVRQIPITDITILIPDFKFPNFVLKTSSGDYYYGADITFCAPDANNQQRTLIDIRYKCSVAYSVTDDAGNPCAEIVTYLHTAHYNIDSPSLQTILRTHKVPPVGTNERYHIAELMSNVYAHMRAHIYNDSSINRGYPFEIYHASVEDFHATML